METKPLSVGPINTGSLLNSSEGILVTCFTGLAGTAISGDYDPSVQWAAMIGLAIAVSAYAISAGLRKSGGKK